jgi:signal transduction histidine kinase
MLAAGILHEVNNVLTPVLAYAQMAASNPDDRELHERAIEKSILGVETATRIASSLLAFAGDDDSTESDVSNAVAKAVNCVALDPNKLLTQVKIDVQHGVAVRMNPLHLQQVLMNLIINALNALEGRGAAGRLTIAAITRADGSIGIRVADNGPGIPREIAGRIFEPFVSGRKGSNRTGSSASNVAGGSGLGLSICRRLVEQAGGTITASSTPGQGSTFLIVVPSPKQRRAIAG